MVMEQAGVQYLDDVAVQFFGQSPTKFYTRQAEKEAERVSRVCGLPISTYIRSQRCGCRAILIL